MKSLAALALPLLLVLCTATADAAGMGYGPRIGYTHDAGLDQVHVGGQALIGDFGTNLVVIPSLEVGFGSDMTLLALNGDVVYDFTELATATWGFYAGLGLAFNRWNYDTGNHNDVGMNAVVGTTWSLPSGRNEAFGELRIGIEDSPDFKLTFGVNVF